MSKKNVDHINQVIVMNMSCKP